MSEHKSLKIRAFSGASIQDMNLYSAAFEEKSWKKSSIWDYNV